MSHGKAVALSLAVMSIPLGACTDPSVEVDFDVPEVIADQVVDLRLRVLAPIGEPIRCDQVAFGEVSTDTLEGATVADITTPVGQTVDLPLIPRKGDKLFWVEGLDSAGVAQVAGCAEHGDIATEGELVVVEAEPTKVAAAFAVSDGEGDIGVAVLDSFPGPELESTVRWDFVGAGDFTTGGEIVTDGLRGNIDLPAPSHYGPLSLDVRVRWSRAPLDPLLGFCDPPIVGSAPMPGPAALNAGKPADQFFTTGRFGPGGALAAATNLFDGANDSSVTVAYWVQNGTLVSASLAVSGDPIKAITTTLRSSSETLVAITETSIHDLTVTASAIVPDPTPVAHTLRAGISRIESLHSCNGPDDAPLFAVAAGQADTAGVFVIDSNGNPLPNFFPQGIVAQGQPRALLNAGCVGKTDDTTVRVLLVERADQAGLSAVTVEDPPLATLLPIAIGATGFAPAIAQSPAKLLVGEFAFDGFNMSSYRLEELPLQQQTRLLFSLESTSPLASAAVSVTGGDIDDNGTGDAIATVVFPGGTAGARAAIEAIVGRSGTEEPVLGLSLAAPGEIAVVGDFFDSGDSAGVDDLLLGSGTTVTLLGMGEIADTVGCVATSL